MLSMHYFVLASTTWDFALVIPAAVQRFTPENTCDGLGHWELPTPIMLVRLLFIVS